VLEPYARSWLEQDTRDEMARMKRLLEGAGEAVAP
jgi:hypothetical protein